MHEGDFIMANMILSLSMLLLIVSTSYAGKRCFCVPTYPYVANDVEVKVITKEISLISEQQKAEFEKRVKTEKQFLAIFAHEYNKVLSAIPLSPRLSTLRQFEFTQNWPETPPSPQVRRSETTTFFQSSSSRSVP